MSESLPIQTDKNSFINITINNHRYILIDTFILGITLAKTMIVINTSIIAASRSGNIAVKIHYGNGKMILVFDNMILILKFIFIIIPPRYFTFRGQRKVLNINSSTINPHNISRSDKHPNQPKSRYGDQRKERNLFLLSIVFTCHYYFRAKVGEKGSKRG